MSGTLYIPPARSAALTPAAGPVASNVAPRDSSIETIERALDLNVAGGSGFALQLGTTKGSWGGIDVYLARPSLSSGTVTALQVSVYAIAFGMRTLVGSGIFDLTALDGGAQHVASVRGLASRWEVEIGGNGDQVTDTVGQIQAVAVASNVVTPARPVGIVKASLSLLTYVTRPIRAYAARVAIVNANPYAALQLFDAPTPFGVPVWSQEVPQGPAVSSAILSLQPPEWEDLWLFNRPSLAWSTTVPFYTAGGAVSSQLWWVR